jgi:hypothetical protein
MHHHKADAHTTGREKMEKVSGSAKNFESQADKAHRFCHGGYAEGGGVGPLPPPVPMPTTTGTPTGDNMSADTSMNRPSWLKGKEAK